MGTRKNAIHLTTAERENFIYALLTMKHTIANPGEPNPARRISVYDQFVAIHLLVQAMRLSGGAPIDEAHNGAAFGPWHREFLRRFEGALQVALGVPPGPPHPGVGVMLPYWDWTDHAGTDSVLFQDSFMGPNGGGAALGGGGGDVLSGYFAFDAPGAGSNPFIAPAGVVPPGWLGWRLRTDLGKSPGTTLRRFIGNTAGLATQTDVLSALGQLSYSTFRSALEGAPRMHNDTHGWVGGPLAAGHMARRDASPNDPIFFLHHCQVDRLWAMWQTNGHRDANSTAISSFYPMAGATFGHNLADPMWPWVGAAAGSWSSDNGLPDVIPGDFSAEPVRHPGDVLDHRALGHAYDTEPVVGIALDQTGSMTGLTPEPMTGMGSVSKWDAAKQGVAALLHDCETAFAAGEAYVTAGVETFRALAANTFTQIFSGTPYGVIKSGGAYGQAVFDANIVAQTPGGGTPLGGALIDTNSQLVFPAPIALAGGAGHYPGNLPADDSRFLMMLTDGIETAPPLLGTLATPEFPNTLIFAMGFGVGSGWDGVDYATLASLSSKGKTAPPGVTTTFHGDSAGAIDKFYGQSIAAVIGYTPAVDPVYELFPGEHVDTMFFTTDADQSFMITVQAFDFSDENWSFCLITPNGDTCVCDGPCEAAEPSAGHSHHAAAPTLPTSLFQHLHDGILVTSKKQNGRITIFLNRNGVPGEDWVGRWRVRAMYRMDADNMTMLMPTAWDMLLSSAAPATRGPMFSRAMQASGARTPVRLQPPVAGQSLLAGTQGLTTASQDACSVSVNVYARSTLQSWLALASPVQFAGQHFEISCVLDAGGPVEFSNITVMGRLVAPRYSIGNVFADLQTIPVRARRKYLQRESTVAPFDQVRFLADYERKAPGSFAVRDEEAVFEQAQDGSFLASIGNTRFPGVYRVSMTVSGTVRIAGGEPQVFTRTHQAEVALGIQPDPVRSAPTLTWLSANRFVVSVTPMDALGNIAAPAAIATPVVMVNGAPVAAAHTNLFTGEHRLEVTLPRGARERGVKVAVRVGSTELDVPETSLG